MTNEFDEMLRHLSANVFGVFDAVMPRMSRARAMALAAASVMSLRSTPTVSEGQR